MDLILEFPIFYSMYVRGDKEQQMTNLNSYEAQLLRNAEPNTSKAETTFTFVEFWWGY